MPPKRKQQSQATKPARNVIAPRKVPDAVLAPMRAMQSKLDKLTAMVETKDRTRPSSATSQLKESAPRRAPPGNGNSSRTIPAGESKRLSRGIEASFAHGKRGGHSIRFQDSIFVGEVLVPADESANTIVAVKPNVCDPKSSRFAYLSQLFQRWQPHRYTYRFRSTQPEGTTSGALVFAQDPDPTTSWGAAGTRTDGTCGRLMAAEGAKLAQAWQTVAIDMPSQADYTSLWCVDNDAASLSDNDRLTSAGQLVICVAAPTGLTAGSVLGILTLEVDIEYYVPKLSGSPSGVGETPTTTVKFSPEGVTRVVAKVAAGEPIIAAAMDEVKRAVSGFTPGGDITRIHDQVKTGLRMLREYEDFKLTDAPAGTTGSVGGLMTAATFRLWVFLLPSDTPPVDMFDGSASVDWANCRMVESEYEIVRNAAGTLQPLCRLPMAPYNAYAQPFEVSFTPFNTVYPAWVDILDITFSEAVLTDTSRIGMIFEMDPSVSQAGLNLVDSSSGTLVVREDSKIQPTNPDRATPGFAARRRRRSVRRATAGATSDDGSFTMVPMMADHPEEKRLLGPFATASGSVAGTAPALPRSDAPPSGSSVRRASPEPVRSTPVAGVAAPGSSPRATATPR